MMIDRTIRHPAAVLSILKQVWRETLWRCWLHAFAIIGRPSSGELALWRPCLGAMVNTALLGMPVAALSQGLMQKYGGNVKRIIGLLGTLFALVVPATTQAQVTYVDLVYQDAATVLPKDSSWIRKLFSDEERKVFLVVSVTRRSSGDSNETLLLPPRILESFERSNGELKRTRSENLRLLDAQFVNDSDQLVLKVEFFSVRKASANAFAESLKSLAAAYVAAGATPQASTVVTSAMDAIGAVLLNNKEVYLSHVGGISTEDDNTISLYFDDSGNINDELFTGADASQRVVFAVVATRTYAVDFNFSFLNQGPNSEETIAYFKLTAAKNSAEKRVACLALRRILRKRFSDSTSNDLVAIAINDIAWAQDETNYHCMEPNDAIRYKRDRGLRYVANCSTDECAMTKMILILLKGNAPELTLASVAGTNVHELDCKTVTRFTDLSRWSSIQTTFESPNFKSYKAKSCLTVGGERQSYEHEFSWLNGTLVTHKCEVLSDNECN